MGEHNQCRALPESRRRRATAERRRSDALRARVNTGAAPRYGKRMRRLAGRLAFLATAQMASCLFPPNLSDGPTNLPLAEDIEKNPTVFGELLRGEAPIRKMHECDAYLSFRNVKDYAPLAVLVIPKRRRPQDPDGLRKADVSLLEDMRRIALEVCQREQPEAFAANDYWLRFHRRPWHSVDHLHLHVLAPASKVSSWTAFIFLAGSPWSLDADALLEKLRR